MAIAPVQSNNTFAVGTTANVILTGVGAGNTLVASVGAFVGPAVSMTVSAGGTWTKDSDNRGSIWGSSVWSAPNVAGGDTTVTFTVGSSGAFNFHVHEYSGTLTAAPKDKETSAIDTVGNTAMDSGLAAATTAAGDLLLGFVYSINHANENFTAGNDGQGDTYTLRGTRCNNTTDGETSQVEDFFPALTGTAYKATMTQDVSGKSTTHVVSYQAVPPPSAPVPVQPNYGQFPKAFVGKMMGKVA